MIGKPWLIMEYRKNYWIRSPLDEQIELPAAEANHAVKNGSALIHRPNPAVMAAIKLNKKL